MVIDFHTHAFPDELAKKAIPKLAANGNIANVGDGTVRSLLAEMGRSGVDRAVILNIATNAKQQTNVNNFAIVGGKAPEGRRNTRDKDTPGLHLDIHRRP